MSKYFPPYNNSSGNIKVELDLSNYATKKDIKDITHIDASGFASKNNLTALKTEVDKIDTDKLKIVPNDLAKLSNVVKNDVVKKTDYNTKICNIETQITLVNKNDLDNLADIKVLKTKTVDTSRFVTRTKLSTDTNALDDEIDKVDKKVPDVTSFAKKADFDSKITEVKGKITNIRGLATNSSLTPVENKIPDITSLITKADFNAKLKNIGGRVTNNKSKDILLNNELKKLKTLVGSTAKTKFDEVQKEISFVGGFFSCTQNSNLVYECKVSSMKFCIAGILEWKPKDIYDSLNKNVLNSVQNIKNVAPDTKNINGQLYVFFNGNYFEQDPITIPNNVINICCVYQLDPISSSRDLLFKMLYSVRCKRYKDMNIKVFN